MAKKWLLVFVIGSIVTSGLFAQSKAKKMSLTIDSAPLFHALANEGGGFGIGAAVEWGFKKNYSVGASLTFGTQPNIDITIAALGRLWPLGQLNKGYVGAEIGFEKPPSGSAGLMMRLRGGWRENLGAFSLEPSVCYSIKKYKDSIYAPSQWDIGLAIGFTL